MSDFKPLREGFFIHFVAFIVATFITNLVTRVLGLAMSGADNSAVVYFLDVIVIFLIWPSIIGWFRLNSNTDLTIYFGVWAVGSPFLLWWYFNTQFSEQAVAQILPRPNDGDVIAGFVTTLLVWWRLKMLDTSFDKEAAEHSKRLAICEQEKEDVSDKAHQAPIEATGSIERPASISRTLSPGLPSTVKETYKLHSEARDIDDEQFYKAALDEYEENEKVPETWAKALTLCKGDEQSAKWKYVELRVEWLLKH